jgi:hypothetical protein
MLVTKKITQDDLLSIAKNYNAEDIYLKKISSLPKNVNVDKTSYSLVIIGGFDNDKIKTIEINYYNTNNFKHLFQYKKSNNMYDALNFIETELLPYKI